MPSVVFKQEIGFEEISAEKFLGMLESSLVVLSLELDPHMGSVS